MKALIPALALALCASAAQAAPRLEAVQAWSRPAAAGGTGAGFLVLANRGSAPDALVSVASPVAGSAMIHRSKVTGGMASMEHVMRVEVPAGRQVTFAPGGYHVMFMRLKKPLATGDTLPATLTFASGAKLEVTFAVRVTPPPAR